MCPKVSVIIPNYNHAKFLKQRIDSVLNQTFQDFEMIILDDCSKDASKEIIETYRNHQKISQIVYNDTNSGSPFKQWKKGIDLAEGEYIWIAESDDIADVDFLSYGFASIDQDKDIALVFTRSLKIDESETVIGVNYWADQLDCGRWNSDYTNDGENEIKNYFTFRNIIPNASSVIFRKNCADPHIWTTMCTMKFTGDWLFWPSIIRGKKICYLAKKLNAFRSHADTTRSTKVFSDEIKRLREYMLVTRVFLKRYNAKYSTQGHQWIIDEWIDKMYLIKEQPLAYLFPPFPSKLLFNFHLRLVRKLFKLYINRLRFFFIQ